LEAGKVRETLSGKGVVDVSVKGVGEDMAIGYQVGGSGVGSWSTGGGCGGAVGGCGGCWWWVRWWLLVLAVGGRQREGSWVEGGGGRSGTARRKRERAWGGVGGKVTWWAGVGVENGFGKAKL
jgi:hypothetical protein